MGSCLEQPVNRLIVIDQPIQLSEESIVLMKIYLASLAEAGPAFLTQYYALDS